MTKFEHSTAIAQGFFEEAQNELAHLRSVHSATLARMKAEYKLEERRQTQAISAQLSRVQRCQVNLERERTKEADPYKDNDD